MKRKLYLIGAGEFGREMESWISSDYEFLKTFEIVGFLDQNPDALSDYPSDFSVVGSPKTFKFNDQDAAILCIASTVIKKRIVEAMSDKVEFLTYISNRALIGKFSIIGKGTIVCPYSIITTNTFIDDFVTVNCGSIIGHDCTVGKYTSIMPHVDLGGHVKIGENNFLGSKTTVIPGISTKEKITIGSGSVVIRNLKKEGTYFGNPAIMLKL